MNALYFHMKSKITDHLGSDHHLGSIESARKSIHFPAGNDMFEYPFRAENTSMFTRSVQASLPIDVERHVAIFDTHIKQLIQGEAARGGSQSSRGGTESFAENYSAFKNLVRLRTLVIFEVF